MKILYFAWLREKIGLSEEDVDLPGEIKTVDELLAWLESRGPHYQQALSEKGVVRVAINQEQVDTEHEVRPTDEVALFPPVTGG